MTEPDVIVRPIGWGILTPDFACSKAKRRLQLGGVVKTMMRTRLPVIFSWAVSILLQNGNV
jgi:hypothetical protein